MQGKASHGLCLLSSQLPPSTKPFQEAQSELNQAAADLNQSAGEVVHATRSQSGELAAASGKFSDDFDEFLDAGIEMAGQAQVGGKAVCVAPLSLLTLVDPPAESSWVSGRQILETSYSTFLHCLGNSVTSQAWHAQPWWGWW